MKRKLEATWKNKPNNLKRKKPNNPKKKKLNNQQRKKPKKKNLLKRKKRKLNQRNNQPKKNPQQKTTDGSLSLQPKTKKEDDPNHHLNLFKPYLSRNFTFLPISPNLAFIIFCILNFRIIQIIIKSTNLQNGYRRLTTKRITTEQATKERWIRPVCILPRALSQHHDKQAQGPHPSPKKSHTLDHVRQRCCRLL